MLSISRINSLAVAAGLALGLAACSPDKDTITGVGSNSNDPTFLNVSSRLSAACGSCHANGSGRTFIVSMDSAALVNSGLLNPGAPGASLILTKPRSTAHGGGIVAAFSTADSALIATWAAVLPNVNTTTLSAVRSEFAPTIDGLGEALWLQATPLTVAVAGGWSAATSVSVRAMYDESYLYMYLRWSDNEASYRRTPWIKNADGSWTQQLAKPNPVDGTTWQAYIAANGGAAFDREAPQFAYEDKFALIWNTYGASTVPAFETVGCASVCHDPANNGGPGTTYNSARKDFAAKKYTTVAGQILDLWHWKMVRQNMNKKMDDQNVRYWVPVNDASAGDGGRAADVGAGGYRNNPAVNGRPTYKSASFGLLPSIFSWAESDTLRMTDAEVAALPTGTMVANMITSPVTGVRADVDAVGVYSPVAKAWTLEIRRRLSTGDGNDVQFSDLTKTYKWGVALFDNAQIEHSISGVPLSLKFKP